MNYTEAIQKIELFSSFFDRLLAPSSNHNQHIQTLTKFKTALYAHIKNPKNIDTHVEELLGSKIHTPDTSSIKSHGDSGSGSKPSNKLSNDLKSEPNSMTSLTETLQMLKENPSISEAAAFNKDYRQSINDLMTIFQLLSRLKATEHADINSLFLMAGDYSHVRTFEHAQHSAFLALSFAFYEKLLLKDLKPSSSTIIDPRLKKIINAEVDKQNAKKSTKSAYRELVLCLKDILEGKHTSNSILLFNLICSNQEMYGSSVALFKEIIHDLSASASFSLQSMNQPSNEALFKSLSSIMKSSITFRLLDSQKLTTKEFNYSSSASEINAECETPRSRINHVTTIFFDQRSNTAYVLYKSHGSKNSPTAKRSNNSPSKGSRGLTVVPVQMGFPQPNFESEKRRLTMIPTYQDAQQPQNPQLVNLLAVSKSDKPKSLHEVNENQSGLTAKGRDPAPVHHTGEGGYIYNLNVIPPGSNTASMNLGHPDSIFGLSSFNKTDARITSVDNLGLLKPPNLGDDLLGHSGSFQKHSSDILNIGHLLPGNLGKNESILSNVGNLLGDISSLSAKPASLNEIKGETSNSVNDLSRAASDKVPMTRRVSLKKIPNFIRTTFEHANKEVQGHESEFNKISETYISKEIAQSDKKTTKANLSNILNKYQTILAKKGDNLSTHMQSGMRMDH